MSELIEAAAQVHATKDKLCRIYQTEYDLRCDVAAHEEANRKLDELTNGDAFERRAALALAKLYRRIDIRTSRALAAPLVKRESLDEPSAA